MNFSFNKFYLIELLLIIREEYIKISFVRYKYKLRFFNDDKQKIFILFYIRDKIMNLNERGEIHRFYCNSYNLLIEGIQKIHIFTIVNDRIRSP